ncbi:MAG: T9SS type A sorting domain-containing protein, partial [Saprospiraceae bacterium]|nr:T9SS type A sorting domain-containing protein [Saprospiraceae bacterium]
NSYWFTTPDHYGSCTTPQGHHMSVKDLTYNSASTHCSVDGYGYHWMLKPYGSNDWQDYESSYNHHTWTGLHYNTKYEYKVKVKCYNGSWTGWSDSYWFTTPDHYDYGCSTPQSHHMSVKDLTYNSATTHCSVDGYEYHWQLKPYGSSQWKDHSGPDPYHNWTGLNYNTKYEYKVKVKCHSGSWTGWSASYWFTTPDHYDNSCSTPQSHHMSVKDLTYNSATTYCSVDGYEYHWQLKPYGSSQWMDHTSNYGYHQWNGLQYNTKYEYKVKVKCHSGSWTGWSASYWFTTPDHYGSCSTPQSHHMSVKNITYNSASTYCSIDGYEYHWALRKYGSYSWTDYSSHYNYHDWNNLHYNTKYEYKVKVKCHDGSWTDWSDGYWFTTHDHYSNCSTPESHHMTVDNISYNTATTHCGVSGMEYHWMMRPYGGGSWSDYTTTNNYHNWTGLQYNTKYEYKVKVKCSSTTWTNWSGTYYFTTHDHAGYGCSTPSGYDFTIYQQEYNLFRIYMYAPFTKWSSQIRKVGSYEWAQHTTTVDNMAWGNLTPNTEYEYRVNRTCSDGTTSGWSGIRTFWTGTGTVGLSGRDIGTTGLEIETGIQVVETNEINVFPNPASDFFSISGVKSGSEITLIDMQGKIVLRKVVGNQHQISLAGLENGLYQIMAIDDSGERQVKRLAVLK